MVFFYKKSFLNEKQEVKICNLSEFIIQNKIENIDVLKIDTEGYDFNVIRGLGDYIKIVKYIYFEHHFHNMLVKDYTLSDVNSFLISNNFTKVFKTKMYFRKTFEYIYFNKSYKED